jgi:hypothetical protein
MASCRVTCTDVRQPAGREAHVPAPTLRKCGPQTNILWLKLTDASNRTSWFPIQLGQFPWACADQLPASQIDNIAAHLAAHLTWIQQNLDAVWNLLRCQPPNQSTQKGNNP